MSARAYPLPRPESGNDPRFTFGLVHDVGKVLEAHGFPPVRNGSDHVDLMAALFGFVFASEERPVPDGMAQARAEEDRIAGELAAARRDEDQPLAARGHGPADPGAPLTFAEYVSALSYWKRRAAEAQASGDQAALAYRTRGVEALQERVTRAEVVAQRCDWHPDLSEEQVLVLASHAGSGVAK